MDTALETDDEYDPPQVTEDFIRGDHTQEEWEEDDDLGDDDLGEWYNNGEAPSALGNLIEGVVLLLLTTLLVSVAVITTTATHVKDEEKTDVIGEPGDIVTHVSLKDYLQTAMDIISNHFVEKEKIDWRSVSTKAEQDLAAKNLPDVAHPSHVFSVIKDVLRQCDDVLYKPHNLLIVPRDGQSGEERLQRNELTHTYGFLASSPTAAFVAKIDCSPLRISTEERMQYLEGGRTVFLVFNNTEAQGKGVEMGFVVTQIEGQDTALMTDKEFQLELHSAPLSGEEGEKSFEFLDRVTNAFHTITLGRISKPVERYPRAKMLYEGADERFGVAYVELFDSIGSPLYEQTYAEQLQSQLLVATSKNACGVILDVRRNIGGPMWPLVSGLSRLLYGNGTSTHEMQMFGEGLQVNGDRFSALQWYTRDGHVYEGTTDRTLHPAPDGVDPDLPLVVLMSGITREGGEQLVAALRGRDRTRLIGSKTYGLTSMQSEFELNDGSVLLLATSYQADRNEERDSAAVAPEVVIASTDEFRSFGSLNSADGGPDATLLAAVSWLKRQCS